MSENKASTTGVRYLLAKRDSYSDGAQRVHSDNNDVLTTVLGVKYQPTWKIGCKTVKPMARVATTYDVISDDSTANVNVLGGGSYRMEGKRLHRLGFETGVGLETSVKDWTFSVEYDGGFRQDFQSHTGMLKAKYNF